MFADQNDICPYENENKYYNSANIEEKYSCLVYIWVAILF